MIINNFGLSQWCYTAKFGNERADYDSIWPVNVILGEWYFLYRRSCGICMCMSVSSGVTGGLAVDTDMNKKTLYLIQIYFVSGGYQMVFLGNGIKSTWGAALSLTFIRE